MRVTIDHLRLQKLEDDERRLDDLEREADQLAKHTDGQWSVWKDGGYGDAPKAPTVREALDNIGQWEFDPPDPGIA